MDTPDVIPLSCASYIGGQIPSSLLTLSPYIYTNVSQQHCSLSLSLEGSFSTLDFVIIIYNIEGRTKT